MAIPPLNEEEIRTRAREIWQRAGRPEGFAADHWLQARWELIGERGGTTESGPIPERRDAAGLREGLDGPGPIEPGEPCP